MSIHIKTPKENQEQDAIKPSKKTLTFISLCSLTTLISIVYLCNRHLISPAIISCICATFIIFTLIGIFATFEGRHNKYPIKTIVNTITLPAIITLSVTMCLYTKTSQTPITSLYTFTLDETFSISKVDHTRFEIKTTEANLITLKDKTEPQTTVHLFVDDDATIIKIEAFINPNIYKGKTLTPLQNFKIANQLYKETDRAIDEKYGRRDTWLSYVTKFDGKNTLKIKKRKDGTTIITIANKIPFHAESENDKREALFQEKAHLIVNSETPGK